MFVSDSLIFVELHKTGCSHIRKLLSQLVEGRIVGKHNPPTPDLIQSGRPFLASVRNPWKWYVSLWAFGCDQKGAVYKAVTKQRYNGFKGRGFRSNPLGALQELLFDLRRHPDKWKRVYADSSDPGCFRDWLQMMYDPKYLGEFGEGYGDIPVSRFAGLMTYRYLYLFCGGDFSGVRNFDELREYDRKNCFIDFFVRNENLEEDFFAALAKFGIPVSEEQKQAILTMPKTNMSSKTKSAAFYYDQASLDLITRRAAFIIEKFGYTPPVLQH